MLILKDLLETCNENHTEIDGKWVPARPLAGPGYSRNAPLLSRLHDAWEVFCGRADAVKWPEKGENK